MATSSNLELAPTARRQLQRTLLVEEDVLDILLSQLPDLQQAPSGPWRLGTYLPLPVHRDHQFLSLAWAEATLHRRDDGGIVVTEIQIQPAAAENA
ncbi:MAG: hypothetical protein AAGD01_00045 [Acidobacteriota bacterium]